MTKKMLKEIRKFFNENFEIQDLLFIVIFAIGAYMIMANLGSLSLHHDDVFHALSAEGILDCGYPRFPSGMIYPRGITLSYAIAFFSLFFGVNEFTVALPSALSGLGTILMIYLLGKKIASKNVALVASFAVAFYPWHVEFARFGRFYELLIFFMLLSLYSFIRGFLEKNGNNFWKVVTVVSVMLASLTCEVGLSLVATFSIIGLLYHKGFRLKKNIFWIIFFVSAIPLSRFVQSTGFVFSPAPDQLGGGGLLDIFSNMFGFLAQFVTTEINCTLFSLYYAAFGFFIIAIVCGAIIRLKTRDIDAKEVLLLILVFMLVTGPLLYYPDRERTRALYPSIPFVILLGLTSVEAITNFVFRIFTRSAKNNTTFHPRKIITMLLMVSLAFTVVNISDSWNLHNKKYGDTWGEYQLVSETPYHFSDTETISIYVSSNKEPGDVVITTILPFYYFYTHEEPDYWWWTGVVPYAAYEENGVYFSRYFSGTKVLVSFGDVVEVVTNTHSPIWIVMQYTYVSSSVVPRYRDWIKYLNAEAVFVGEEPGAVVYYIP